MSGETAPPRPGVEPPPTPTPRRERWKPRRPKLETLVAILVGIVLGLLVVAAFVFTGSEEAIDAPRLGAADAHRAVSAPATPADR